MRRGCCPIPLLPLDSPRRDGRVEGSGVDAVVEAVVVVVGVRAVGGAVAVGIEKHSRQARQEGGQACEVAGGDDVRSGADCWDGDSYVGPRDGFKVLQVQLAAHADADSDDADDSPASRSHLGSVGLLDRGGQHIACSGDAARVVQEGVAAAARWVAIGGKHNQVRPRRGLGVVRREEGAGVEQGVVPVGAAEADGHRVDRCGDQSATGGKVLENARVVGEVHHGEVRGPGREGGDERHHGVLHQVKLGLADAARAIEDQRNIQAAGIRERRVGDRWGEGHLDLNVVQGGDGVVGTAAPLVVPHLQHKVGIGEVARDPRFAPGIAGPAQDVDGVGTGQGGGREAEAGETGPTVREEADLELTTRGRGLGLQADLDAIDD